MIRPFKSIKKTKKFKDKTQKSVTTELSRFLASTYSVYLKTQNFHWNVTGANFISLHAFFEKQYEDLADATDSIAERIRALGAFAPGSLAEFAKLSKIKDSVGKKPAKKMIAELLADHLLLEKLIKELLLLTKEDQDEGTQDLLIGRLRFHEKTIWILRSLS